MSVTAITQNAPARADSAAAQPATPGFAEVHAILDGLLQRWRTAQEREPHIEVHGPRFHWQTREELLNATVSVGTKFRLIDPKMIGNGRARETWLVRYLTEDGDSFVRMPSGGPYATDEEIATIARWIDAGCPENAGAAPPAPAKQSNADTPTIRQFARRYVLPTDDGSWSGPKIAAPRMAQCKPDGC